MVRQRTDFKLKVQSSWGDMNIREVIKQYERNQRRIKAVLEAQEKRPEDHHGVIKRKRRCIMLYEVTHYQCGVERGKTFHLTKEEAEKKVKEASYSKESYTAKITGTPKKQK